MKNKEELLKNKKVLIVEDDILIRKKLKILLEQKGFSVTLKGCVEGKKEGALDELKQNGMEYDFIILDVRLPDTEEKFNENIKLDNDWESLQEQLMALEENENKEDEKINGMGIELFDGIDKLNRDIHENINVDGGIKIIQQWGIDLLNEIYEINQKTNENINIDGGIEIMEQVKKKGIDIKAFLIYFTSRKEIPEFKKLYTNSTFISKPISITTILDIMIDHIELEKE